MGILTGQNKEDDPVHDQDRPEDGNVEDLKPRAGKRDDNGAGGPVPELELGESADKGLELLVAFRGEGADVAVLHVVVELIVGGVKLGLEEGEEEVQEIDSEGIGN